MAESNYDRGSAGRQQGDAGGQRAEEHPDHALSAIHPNPMIAARMYRTAMQRRNARRAAGAPEGADEPAAAANGGGPNAVPATFGERFGRSFDGVRLHTDDTADARARSLGTEAVTEGKDVYFRAGAYAPDTAEGQKIIGHELAHVVQQDSVSHATPQGFGVPVGERGTELEHEATRAGEVVAAGGRPQVSLRASAPVAQRFESREH